MVGFDSNKRPIDWKNLRTDQAEKICRDRAAQTDNVIFGAHAYHRIVQRGITQVDVYNILRGGHVEGEPRLNRLGDWEVVMVKRMPGGREAGAVTIIFRGEEKLFVKTVEWIDYR